MLNIPHTRHACLLCGAQRRAAAASRTHTRAVAFASDAGAVSPGARVDSCAADTAATASRSMQTALLRRGPVRRLCAKSAPRGCIQRRCKAL